MKYKADKRVYWLIQHLDKHHRVILSVENITWSTYFPQISSKLLITNYCHLILDKIFHQLNSEYRSVHEALITTTTFSMKSHNWGLYTDLTSTSQR